MCTEVLDDLSGAFWNNADFCYLKKKKIDTGHQVKNTFSHTLNTCECTYFII